MPAFGTFDLVIGGEQQDGTVETKAKLHLVAQGSGVLRDDVGNEFKFPTKFAKADGEGISLNPTYTITLFTDSTSGNSTTIGYEGYVRTDNSRVTFQFAAPQAGSTVNLVDLTDSVVTPISDLQTFRDEAEAAAAAAAASATSVNREQSSGVAGLTAAGKLYETRIPDRLSDASLSATYGAGGIHPQRAVALGDSITDQGYSPNGGAPYYASRGWWPWANAYLGGRFNFANDAGLTGDRLDQIYARFQAGVLDYAPGWVFLDGGTNDLFASATYATIVSRFQQIFDACATNKIRVVVLTILPRTITGGFTSGMNTTRGQVNDWLRAYGSTNRNVVVVDCDPYLADPAVAGPKTTLFEDGLHPAAPGAQAIGYATFLALRNITVPRSPCLSGVDPTNLYGAAGAFPGNNGAGVSNLFNSGGGTATYSKVAATDGVLQEWQQVVVTGTNTSYLYPATDITTGFAVGDTVQAHVEFEFSGVDTAATTNTLKTYIKLMALTAGGGGIKDAIGMYDDLGTHSMTFPVATSGVLSTPPFVVPATAAKLRAIIYNDGGMTRKFRRLTVRKL